jgi:heme/copper-type cytochrome/quinol oxidase subunit 2
MNGDNMTEQDTANLMTFVLAIVLGIIAFIAGWMWGFATCENQYRKDENVKDNKG